MRFFLSTLLFLILQICPLLAQEASSARPNRALLTARASELKIRSMKAKADVAEATHIEPQRQAELLSKQSALDKARESGSGVTEAEADLAVSQSWLELATQVKESSSKQLMSLESEQSEINLKLQWLDLDDALRALGSESAESQALRAKLDAMALEIAELEIQTKGARERALEAEQRVRQLQLNPTISQPRATRATRRHDLWQLPPTEEKESTDF